MPEVRISDEQKRSWHALDGQDLKQLTRAALAWLQRHQAAINALNVYPVPDGDTGTNMVLTMQAAWAEIAEWTDQSVGKTAHRMAHGAMMGARGNSGVILSQIWRGLARSLDEKALCHAQDLAVACQEAAATAYKGVLKPVEGTILTVARAIADAAIQAAAEAKDVLHVLERSTQAAREAVAMTPSLLPVLAEAGVVDAGGQGLLVIWEGMLRHLRGEPIADHLPTEAIEPVASLRPPEIGYGYDVQFLLVGRDLDPDAIRQRLAEMGDCALAVGDSTTVKVHVHVPDPGVPISYGASLGSLRDVVIEDMQAQYQGFVAGATPASHPTQEIGVVAVAMGEGLVRVFKSLGAGAVVNGGQTMNPSTMDLLTAIQNLPANQAILLPNNSNVVLTAEQARTLSAKPVAVIPTHFIPQGISALMAFDYQADLETNVAAMTAASQEIQTGEITYATRSAMIDGIHVANGQIIGLHNGKLKVAGSTVEQVAQDLLKEMDADQYELITLYYGLDVRQQDADALAELLRSIWPDHEIQVIAGGQPHYHYILSLE